MSYKETYFSNAITHYKPRRCWADTLWSVLVLLIMAALCVWLWSCVREVAGTVSSFKFQVSGLAMAPVLENTLLGFGLILVVNAVILLCLYAIKVLPPRKVERPASGGRWREEFQRILAAKRREYEMADVFAPLREPGGPIPDEYVHQILVSCAAEARCVAKHVERARRTMSVDDYADELQLAAQKLDAVIRCVEQLAERFTLKGDIEQCEMEGGAL